MTNRWQGSVKVSKVDASQHLVFGWLSVCRDKDGNLVEDSQGHVIHPEDLEPAVYDYNLKTRTAGDMHVYLGVGALVESVMFTAEKMEAMGIPPGLLPQGWWVGYKIEDEDTWARIVNGELAMLSIGGSGSLEDEG